jgi:hypothetical protein
MKLYECKFRIFPELIDRLVYSRISLSVTITSFIVTISNVMMGPFKNIVFALLTIFIVGTIVSFGYHMRLKTTLTKLMITHF